MSVKFKNFPWANETFDEVEVIEGSPRLYVTPEGKFPSVTSLLSIIKDGGLEAWRKRVGEEEAERITTEASERGNALHDYNEKYLRNELQRSELSGQAKVLFNRVKRYLDEVELVIATEVPLWNVEDQYAGRVDAVVMLNGQITILDHKNSRNPINLNMSFGRRKAFKYCLQLYAYARALHYMKGYMPTKGCLIVGNHLTSTANKIDVDLLDPFWSVEFDKVLEAYHKSGDISHSAFFSL